MDHEPQPQVDFAFKVHDVHPGGRDGERKQSAADKQRNEKNDRRLQRKENEFFIPCQVFSPLVQEVIGVVGEAGEQERILVDVLELKRMIGRDDHKILQRDAVLPLEVFDLGEGFVGKRSFVIG